MKQTWLAALAVVGGLLSADPAAAEARNLRFERLSLEQGLSQSHVNCILQDRHGFLWLGTQDGLNRYDGYRFRVFKHDAREPGSLASNTVWALFEDKDGALWVGTDGGGLDRWDPTRETFVHHQLDPKNPKSLSGNRVRAIVETKDGALWVGTDGAGLSRLDRKTSEFTRYPARPDDPRGLSSNRIRYLMEDRDGALWIATDGGGLARLDSARVNFTTYRTNPTDPGSLSDDRVRHVYQDRDGVLWVGTYQAGLNRFEGGRRFTRFRKGPEPGSLPSDRVRAILQDRLGALWVGTDGGLSEWRPESQRFVSHAHRDTDRTSLSENRVLSLYQDGGGVLWVGTQGGGLNKWNTATGSFALVRSDPTSPSSLVSNRISSFASGADGVLWVGTSEGLTRMDRRTGEVRSYRNDPRDPRSLSDSHVMSLLVDRKGRLWVGTFEGGLNLLESETGRFRHFRPDPKDPASLIGPGISALLEDREGRLWVGVFRGGLDRFDPESGKAVHYRSTAGDPASLSSDSIISLSEDRAGQIWVGTDGAGFNRFDPASGKATRYRSESGNPTSLSSDAVFVIHEDRQGDLWMGTQGGGLNRWRAKDRAAGHAVFTRYTEREGLANDTVYGLLEEDSGTLWLSTNRGLSRLDPETGSFRNFDATHGLQSDEFNFGAYHQAPTGEMFFGGIDGFNSFVPSRVRRNEYVPPVALTSIQKLNREVRGQDLADVRDLTLDYRDYVVSFEYAALDFAAPERNRYAYKLEGLDRDWVAAGFSRRASYTNLRPGHYVFRVKASNGDGVWNEDGLAVRIDVEPPPWRSGWAYAAYALLAAGAFRLYARNQERKRHREVEYSQRLKLQVEDRTAELAQRNQELEQVNRKLEDASLTDSLTGLSNRRFLMAQMPQDVAVVERYYRRLDPNAAPPLPGNRPDFALMMIDLDGLKGVNDTYGHAAGDRVLTKIREILERACRKSDTLVRWGGDEFLVVARYVEPEVVEALAERIRRAVEEHEFDLGQARPVHLGCSIGFALYPFLTPTPNLLTWEQVGSIADRALYAAKSSGRNAWVGILGTATTPTEDVVHLVSHRPATLAREGSIEVRSSLADKDALVWERRVVPRESEPLVSR